MAETTLEGLARAVVGSGSSPGLAIAAIATDGTVRTAAAGVADLATRAPVGAAATPFELGSIGKSFTAVLVLQLVDEGRLDLDAPVADALPWFAVRSRHAPIALHHLLTHTAGIVCGSDIATASSFDAIALAETEAATPPGARFHYSNVGYRALGLVLERVAGRPYGTLVRERILDPLGLADTLPVLVNDDRRRLATGHVPWFDDRPWRPEHGHRPCPWIESSEADGCLAATAVDAARWGAALAAGLPGLLAPASAARLRHPHVPVGTDGLDDEDAYGYGVRVGPGRIGHTGGMIGGAAYVDAHDADGLAIAVVANASWASVWPSAIARAARAILAGEPAEAPAPPAATAAVDDGSCPEPLAACRGVYRSFNAWAPRVRVLGAADGLALDVAGAGDVDAGALAPLPEGGFRLGPEGSPERVAFDTWLDGAPQRLVLSGTVYHRVGIVSPGADR